MNAVTSTSWLPSEENREPIDGGRWVQIVARIRHNSTGEVREYKNDTLLLPDEHEPSDYPWADGNYACDCNRALFFGYAIGLSYEDIPDRACTDTEFAVQLVNPADGRVYYDEFEEGDSP